MNDGLEIISINDDSPFIDSPISVGDRIVFVDDQVIDDIIDWKWSTTEESINVSYIPSNIYSSANFTPSDILRTDVSRDFNQDWGITFANDIGSIKRCANNCMFCFVDQLPTGLRDSLYVKDDDYRLSFLTGTFATLTNLKQSDIEKIVTQQLSPLRFSLHAIDPSVRKKMIGDCDQRGIDAFYELSKAGIEFDCQIVLVPRFNDSSVLDETLQWAYDQPSILNIGIVPLGFTKHQRRHKSSFTDSASALNILRQIEPFQKRAQQEKGYPWVYASDEFYINAYGNDVLNHLPSSTFYGDYSLYEDGIGIIRSCVDDFQTSQKNGLLNDLFEILKTNNNHLHFVIGESMRNYFPLLLSNSEIKQYASSIVVKNDFFGGNVDVTGLLAGKDIINAINPQFHSLDSSKQSEVKHIVVLFDVLFNDDGLTIDDMTIDDFREHIDFPIYVVSSNPLDYIHELIDIMEL